MTDEIVLLKEINKKQGDQSIKTVDIFNVYKTVMIIWSEMKARLINA